MLQIYPLLILRVKIIRFKNYLDIYMFLLVHFTPISSSPNDWTHFAEELGWNLQVEAFFGEWLDMYPY